MKKRIIITIILFTFSLNLAYTIERIDSLITILTKQNEDTNKINTLTDITFIYLYSDSRKALNYLDTLIILSNKLNSYKGKFYYYTHLGIFESIKANFDSSNVLFEKAYQIALDENDYYRQALSKLNIGCNYDQLGNFNKAIESFNTSIEICQKYNIKGLLARNYIALGILNSSFKNYNESEKNYLDALKIYEEIGDKKLIAMVNNNLANLYISKDDNEKALIYTEKNIQLNKELKDFYNLAISYHTMGVINYNLKNYKKSLLYFNKSLEIKENQNNQIGKATTLLALAELYTTLNHFSKALICLDKAKEIFIEQNIVPKLINTYRAYYQVYYKTGDYKKAFDYLNQYYEIKDSLFNLEKEKTLAELNAKYNLEKKEKENLKLQSEKQALTLYMIIFILGFIILVGLAVVLYINNRYVKKLNRQLNELNATKDKFFSIISHDLRNPMSAHYRLLDILIDDYQDLKEEERIEILKQLNISSRNTYSLLENLLTWARTQQNKIKFNPVDINIELLTKLIIEQLQSNWIEKNITIKNQIAPDTIIKADSDLLSTILRNIISNSIKYTNQNGEISISLSKSNKNEIVVSISDNGVGMKSETANNLFSIDKTRSTLGTNDEKGTGLGLILAKEFIVMHKGRIWVESEYGKGTCVSFALPNNNYL